MKYTKFSTICASVFFSLTLFITGCGKKETPVDRANREKLLLLDNGTEPTNLDPAFGNTTTDASIMRAVFEGLLIYNQKTLTLEPALATHWEISNDGLTYTFHLRDNIHFSNGDPITAHNFVFTVQRILSPRLGSIHAEYLQNLKHAKQYHNGSLQDFSQVGIKALDNQTLQFQLEQPDPFFLNIGATSYMAPLHPETLAKFDATDSMNGAWLRPENFVGNGPFTITEWKTNQYVEVTKNPNYWNSRNVKLNKVRFLSTESPANAERAFRAGQLHITNNVPLQKFTQYRKQKDPRLHTCELNGVYAYLLNTSIVPLNDARVRQALNLSINRAELVDKVFQDGRKPAYNFTPSIIHGYHPIYFINEDIAKARELLAEAGYPNGEGFPALEISMNSDASHIVIAESIQAMWKKNLNINVKLINMEWKVLIDNKRKQNYQILRAGWITDLLNPWDIMKNFSVDSIREPTGWTNKEFDNLLKAALKAHDLPTRFKYLAQAEAILLKDGPVIPISFYVMNNLVHPTVQGWTMNSANIHYFQCIDLIPTTTKTNTP
jgi:oligopeptide transport system substrate-binding protein